MSDDRHIRIGGDAAGNTVITGDGNVVIIQTTHLLELDHPPAAPSIGPNPYQGLAAFTEKEADRFFGRETLTQKLWRCSARSTSRRQASRHPCACYRFSAPRGVASRRSPGLVSCPLWRASHCQDCGNLVWLCSRQGPTLSKPSPGC